MRDQKKESAMEEKRRVSFHEEQRVIESISTLLENMNKFEAQNMEYEVNLGYKLYKTISFLPSISFLSFDFIINESNKSQILGRKAKEEGMGKELSIGYEDTSISLSLNPFLLCHEFYFKELKLFLELYAAYVTLVTIQRSSSVLACFVH
ncbi:hypothetical protein M9H77_17504 [Catharanthus roseus]|uniref:Uncharacterized protein n=1 Tax=Catharanthus roseus TaxID=4058 RepID=A0ACC0B4S1_CATRO|nr:hypothetical protein M9H77_17504 [Catharanthus roseus]